MSHQCGFRLRLGDPATTGRGAGLGYNQGPWWAWGTESRCEPCADWTQSQVEGPIRQRDRHGIEHTGAEALGGTDGRRERVTRRAGPQLRGRPG